MAGTSQADRAAADASGSPSRCRQSWGIAQFGAIRTTASSLGVDVSPINVLDAGEIERAIAAFAHTPNGGLIVALAARYKLPAVYADSFNVRGSGLIS